MALGWVFEERFYCILPADNQDTYHAIYPVERKRKRDDEPLK
jgi:hypothetical protein